MLPMTESNLLVGHGTHVGNWRHNNEDRYLVRSFPTANGESATLAIVADGMGGLGKGYLASELVTQMVGDIVEQSSHSNYRTILEEAIAQVVLTLSDYADSDPDQYQGIATTCAVAVVIGQHLHATYIGDSRLYLLRGHTIQQLSKDHSLMSTLIERGHITPKEALHHPSRHVLVKLVANDPKIAQPDFRLFLSDDETSEQAEINQGMRLEAQDVILICSDGLSDVVEDTEIFNTIRKAATPQAAVDNLIALARQHGGPDNITAIVLQVPPEADAL